MSFALDLLRALRRLEREEPLGHRGLQVPAPDDGAVLRLARLLHVADHQLAGQRLLAGVDPDLPLDRVLGEREVVAGDARGLVDAQVAPVGHARHEHGVGIGVEEIGQRQHDPVLVLELVEGRVDRPRGLDRGVDVVLLVEQRHRPAVVPGGAVERVAGRVGRHVVRSLHRDPADVGQLSAQLAVGELVEGLLRLQGEVGQLGQELAHPLQLLVGAGFDAPRGRGRRRRPPPAPARPRAGRGRAPRGSSRAWSLMRVTSEATDLFRL